MRKTLCMLLVAGWVCSSPAWSQNVPWITIKGPEVAKRTEKVLTKIKWADSLDDAMAQAKAEKKLVFWVQIVGELGGGL